MYFNILIPVICVFFNIIFQVFSCKFFVKNGLLKTVYIGFACGLIFFILFEFIAYSRSPKNWLPLAVANLIIYGCLSFNFFTFINMGETARRIRLLRELIHSPDGLTIEQIFSKYSGKEIIDIRMNRLSGNGQVILRDGCYFIKNPLMLSFSKIILLMKLFIMGKRSEFG